MRVRLRWRVTRWLHRNGSELEWHDSQATVFPPAEAFRLALAYGGEVVR